MLYTWNSDEPSVVNEKAGSRFIARYARAGCSWPQTLVFKHCVDEVFKLHGHLSSERAGKYLQHIPRVFGKIKQAPETKGLMIAWMK